MTTRELLRALPRSVRSVELDGGGSVWIRSLTLRELALADDQAEALPEGPERAVRCVLWINALALAEENGSPVFPELARLELLAEADRAAAIAAALEVVAGLTPLQLRQVADAAVPDKAAAKNG